MTCARTIILAVSALTMMAACKQKARQQAAAGGDDAATITTATSATLPSYPVADITELDIAHADTRIILRRRADGEWMMLKPAKALADRRSVEAALQELKRMEGEAAPVTTRPEDWGRYNVTPGESVVIRLRAGDRALPVLHLGRKKWVRIGDSPAVLTAYHINYFTFARAEARLWRDRTLARFAHDAATALHVSGPKGPTLSASKVNGNWTLSKGAKLVGRFDPAAPQALLRRLAFLMAHDQATVSPQDAGLDTPRGTLRIELAGGKPAIELAVGNSRDGFTYVSTSRLPGVWMVKDHVAKVLLVEPDSWRKR